MLLNQCGAETTIEDSMEATNSDHSSVDFRSNARKRKAEFEPGEEEEEEEEEESDEEEEGVGDGRAKIEEEPEARIDYLKAPEWDVDSFDGLEYYSSPEPILSSSDEEFFPEEARQHYRIFKRQMIESKGFYGDRELRPTFHYKGISPMKLEQEALPDQNFRQFWQEMVYVCLQKLNQDKDLNVEFIEVVRGYYRPGPRSKSYIIFMAREKPDGPLVEYQAKCMVTLDGESHPILCRPAPTLMP
ncbi:PREDICTED: uncharacterized protein LOC104715475 [Camelina sativa]|uniref:Uncharacterized protein LOC104715475 n=1 Tax=Camelina sativa TaxID=90675 RepID=A0ABM0TTL5_CAMSA|nr:PREDICTED: uncharacterized protein LOC104715475 [Camelina sativa]XP_010431187.1 PREDICTED: uncharacterized protein LOC104715475 [Camelina sativa]